MKDRKLKDKIIEMIEGKNFTDKELIFILDIIFYTYTEDEDMLEEKVEEFIYG